MTVIGIPFLWLLLFLVVPFAIVFKISFAEMAVARPPFTELFAFAEEKLSVVLTLANVDRLAEDRLTWNDEVYLSWQPGAAVVLTW